MAATKIESHQISKTSASQSAIADRGASTRYCARHRHRGCARASWTCQLSRHIVHGVVSHRYAEGTSHLTSYPISRDSTFPSEEPLFLRVQLCASWGMAGGNRQLLLVGFTLVGGALGFYVEEKIEAYYKEERFKRFEAAVQARVKAAEAKK